MVNCNIPDCDFKTNAQFRMAKHFKESHPTARPQCYTANYHPPLNFYYPHCLMTFGLNFQMLLDHSFISPGPLIHPPPATTDAPHAP
ncbi:hypothetical protein Tco_0639144 [Tanacetum coccineum]